MTLTTLTGQPDNRGPACISYGSLSSGFKVKGPFDSIDDAIKWLERTSFHLTAGMCSVQLMEAPEAPAPPSERIVVGGEVATVVPWNSMHVTGFAIRGESKAVWLSSKGEWGTVPFILLSESAARDFARQHADPAKERE